ATDGERWKNWGPYLSERQWGTVREDYSPYGNAWDYFPHDHARSRAYRWGEDGLLGVSDNHQRLCFALALWNEKDPILKERLFGLTGNEGNHGEDVKEYYFYLDSTPTHSYLKALYKYPQAAFPYEWLVNENKRRGRQAPEFELTQTGVFDENRYFDVFVEYAKGGPEDLLVKITAVNRGPAPAPLHLLPSLWYRNVWSWNRGEAKPSLKMDGGRMLAEHPTLGKRWLVAGGSPDALFTENETNVQRLFRAPNASPYVKDAFHRAVIERNAAAVNPARTGTKAAFHYHKTLQPLESWTLKLRLTMDSVEGNPLDAGFDRIFSRRISEADEFYAHVIAPGVEEDARDVQRQAFAGMLWSKQYYRYIVKDWLEGDPGYPPPSAQRRRGRNRAWEHVYSEDVLSMPDNWEYPWFAAWDLG